MKSYANRRFASKRKYARKGPRKYARRVYKKSSFATRVKKIVHRMAENKQWTNYAVNQSISTNVGAGTPTQFGLLPTIAQGGTTSQRIGNRINIVKNILKYKLNLLPYNLTTNPGMPTWVKIWVFSLKNKTNIQGALTSSDYNNFFQAGSTVLNFQGNVLDTLLNPNKDLFTIHATRTHILCKTDFINYPSGGANPAVGGYFDLSKYCKTCRYNDNTTDVADKSLWMVCQAVYMDGTTGTGLVPAEIHFVQEVEFEDM